MNIRMRMWIVRTIVVFCCIFFVIIVAYAVLYAPTDEVAIPVAGMSVETLSAGEYPVRLRIPSIAVNAKVQQAGLTKTGAMCTPTNFTDVSWYKYGPAPGQLGSAVIDGHVDNGLGLAGVFKNLDKISVGDDIYVDTGSSTSLHFLVEDIESYPYKQVPTEQIFDRNDTARLNLITCEGTWVAKDRTYDGRLVVYAVLVNASR